MSGVQFFTTEHILTSLNYVSVEINVFFLFRSSCVCHFYSIVSIPSIFRDNGLKAIENLMEKKGKFDYILLETTGLADPGITYFTELK